MEATTKISIVAAALAPFLIIAGMSANDVELTDGNEFKDQAAYETYRDDILTRELSIAEFQEIIAVIKYENEKAPLIETIEDLSDFKKNPRTYIKNKLELAKIIEAK